MVDDEPGRIELPDRVGQRSETLDVADVEHGENVGAGQGLDALRGRVDDVVAEQEVEERGPRRGVDDFHRHAALREQPGERRLGPAAVAIGVDVCRKHDATARDEVRRELLDRLAAVGRNDEEVCWGQAAAPGLYRQRETAPGGRAPSQR
jgi:hypothetical protein